jgi:hypothetical protein
MTGSYAFAFYVLAAVVAALGVCGMLVHLPGEGLSSNTTVHPR